jgi:hypothetical protein
VQSLLIQDILVLSQPVLLAKTGQLAATNYNQIEIEGT